MPGWQEIETRHSQTFVMMLVLLLQAAAIDGGASDQGAFREVQAGEVLDRIRDGLPVYYDGVTVVGDLNLTGLGNVRSSVILINSSIPEGNFEGVTFEKDTIFWNTIFSNVSFAGTSFKGFADFSNTSWNIVSFAGSEFYQPALFDASSFLNDATFEDAQFKRDASFNWVQFLGDARFNYSQFDYYSFFCGARFLEKALFSDIKFQGSSDFSEANFAQGAYFIRSEFLDISFIDAFFGGPAQFGLTRYYRLSSFNSAVFMGEANFNLVRFDDAASFTGTQFRDNASFGGDKADRILSFRNASFGRRLVLRASQFRNILFEGVSFGKESKIVLEDSEYTVFRAPWKSIENHVDYNGAAYLALVKNYRDLEWFGDSNDCYFSYRQLSIEHEPLSPMKLLDYLSWFFYGFGVKPQIPLGWSMFIISTFGIIFGLRKSLRKFIRTETIKMVPSDNGRLEAQIETTLTEEPVSFIDPFLFSLTNFTSGWTTFLYPFTDFKMEGGHSHLAITERILGSVFISLILAAIIRTYLIR